MSLANSVLDPTRWRRRGISSEKYLSNKSQSNKSHLGTLVELYEGQGNEVKAAEYRELLRQAEPVTAGTAD
jgi:hypothetical protein